MHVERKSELRSLLKSGDKRCKLVEPRNTKSCVWRFFNLVSCDDRIEPYACCKTCGDLLSYSGKTGTGSLLRHRCLHSSNGKFRIRNLTHASSLPRVSVPGLSTDHRQLPSRWRLGDKSTGSANLEREKIHIASN